MKSRAETVRTHRWIVSALALAVLCVGPGCRRSVYWPSVPTFTQEPADSEHLEACYRVLADDDAGTESWQRALHYIALPDNVFYGEDTVLFPELEGGETVGLAGEPLRARSPSVTELASQRIRELEDEDDVHISDLCSMTLDLATWNLDGALPVLREQMARELAQWSEEEEDEYEEQLRADCIAEYTVARVEANDADALDEYADWIVRTTPGGNATYESLAPVWTYPDSPAMAEVAETLFADPESSWLPLLFPEGNGGFPTTFTDLLETPLVDLPIVRRQLLQELALDHVVVLFRIRKGTLTVSPDFKRWHTSGHWSSSRGFDPEDPRRSRRRRRGEVRYREYLALEIGHAFDELEFELYWKSELREAAFVEIEARLRDEAPLFEAECFALDDSPVCRHLYGYGERASERVPDPAPAPAPAEFLE